MQKQRIWARTRHILMDMLFLWASFILAYFVRVGFLFSTDIPFSPYAWQAGIAAAIWSFFLLVGGYYRLQVTVSSKSVLLLLRFGAGLCAVGGILALHYFSGLGLFSRLMSLLALLYGTICLSVTHWAFSLSLARQKREKKHVYRTLVLGANRVASRLISEIKTDPYAPYHIIGVLDPYGTHKTFTAAPLLGKLNILEEVCRDESITAILMCDGFEHTLSVLGLCKEHNILFQFVPALRGVYETQLRLRPVGNTLLMSYVDRPQEKSSWDFLDKLLIHIFGVH